MRRLAIALGVFILLAALGLGTALAATEISAGNNVTDRQHSDGWSNFYLVDTNSPFTADGRVERWQIWAEKKAPVALAIFRHSGDTWSLVGESGMVTPADTGFREFSLSSSIEVKSGDYVGLRVGREGGAVSYDKADDAQFQRRDLLGSVKFTDNSSANAVDFKYSSDRRYSVRAIGIAAVSDDDDDEEEDEDDEDDEEFAGRWSGNNGNGRNFGAHLSGRRAGTGSRAQGQVNFRLSKDGGSLSYRLNVANIRDVVSAGMYRDDDGDDDIDGELVARLYPHDGDEDLIEGRTQGTLARGVIRDDDLMGSLDDDDLSDLMAAIRGGHVYVAVFTDGSDDPEILGWLMGGGDGADDDEEDQDEASSDDDGDSDGKLKGWEKHGKDKDKDRGNSNNGGKGKNRGR